MDLIARPIVSISIPIETHADVAGARRRTTETAVALHLAEGDVGKLGLIVTEAATNIVQHAGRGEILLRALAPAGVEVLALDRGPGIANVNLAMQGVSTTSALGCGLGSIARLSSFFEISSTPGKGTALLARVGERAPTGTALAWGVVCVSKPGQEVCGDGWAVARSGGVHNVLVVDGVGHGPPAFDSAQQVLRAFHDLSPSPPAAALKVLHEALRGPRGTRGAVAAIAQIDWHAREVRYAGAGNIAGTIVPVEGAAACLVSQPGTLGQQVSRIQEFTYAWPDEGVLILHSDGLSDRWSLEPYPGLTRKDPSLIAGVLYRDFAARRDDVVVFVGRKRREDAP